MIISFRDGENNISEWDLELSKPHICEKWFIEIEAQMGAVCLDKKNMGYFKTAHD